MVLSTHAIVGGAVGRILSGQPILALILGFVSHFLLDAIPHWDYKLGSLDKDEAKPLNTSIRLDRSFAYDCLKLVADVLIGLIIAWLAFGGSAEAYASVVAGIFGGLLPDFLQFVYFRFRREPLKSLQRFHQWIHTNVRLDGRPALGIFLQSALAIVVIIATKTLVESKFVNFLPELIASVKAVDLLDVVVVAIGIYLILLFVKETRSFLIANTVMLLAGLYYAAEHFNLTLVRQLFQPFLAFVIVIFAIVFQRELRRFFEWFVFPSRRLGRRGLSLTEEAIDTIIKAVKIMADKKIGALIILPGDQPLEPVVDGGYGLDGRISVPLILSIFDSSSPGHDGAMLIDAGRVKRFGLHLPLADKFDRTLGTRHRAAAGLSERSDALVIAVSEERGTVSVAQNGVLTALRSPEELEDIIATNLPEEEDAFEYFLLRNFWWKLSALAIALVLWFILIFQTGTVKRDFVVPVAFRFTPSGLVVSQLNTEKVTISVSGSKRDLLTLDPTQLAVTLDLSGESVGPAQVSISEKDINLPSYLKLESIKPANLRFNITPEKAKP